MFEVRDLARDLVDHLLTGFPSPRLREAIDGLTGADGIIAVSPIFSASYSGLFKTFFDVLEMDALRGTPVGLGATGGSARHSLALEHALRPLFAYLGAAPVPTGVFAATDDWGDPDGAADLARRIQREGEQLADAIAGTRPTGGRRPVQRPGALRAAARGRGWTGPGLVESLLPVRGDPVRGAWHASARAGGDRVARGRVRARTAPAT